MKIFVYADLKPECQFALKKKLKSMAEVVLRCNCSDSEMKRSFETADILIGNPPAKWFENPPEKLVFWQLETAGFDQYENLKFEGTVANVGDISAQSCAETIVSSALAFYRGVHRMVRFQDKKEWVGDEMNDQLEILGKQRAIILGSGAIALHARKILEVFGCPVKMTAKSDPKAEIHSFEELLVELPETDLVINTLPGSLDDYVSEDFFKALKEGSLYASVGRGNTTDEAAMIEALKAGKIRGAVLDVTEVEPLPEDSKLWEMKNVILTQHTGAGHKNQDSDKVEKFAENVLKFLNKETIEDEVKLSDGY